MADNDLHTPGFNAFSPIPNQAVDPTKVPSIYNQVIKNLMQKKGVQIQPKIEIFSLANDADRTAYEELMFKIQTEPGKYQYIQAKDHWTKEGDFLRAIDYVEIYETKKKVTKDEEDESLTAKDVLDAPAKNELRKELDEKAESVRKEMAMFDKTPEQIKKEIEEDMQKMDEAIEEGGLPVSEEHSAAVTVEATSDASAEASEVPTEVNSDSAS